MRYAKGAIYAVVAAVGTASGIGMFFGRMFDGIRGAAEVLLICGVYATVVGAALLAFRLGSRP
jgi:hypothetical protein